METEKNQQPDDLETADDPGTAGDAGDAERTRLDDLGETDEDRLETVAERNESLEERLPGGDDLPRTDG
jgi:hypothetical protein